MVNIICYGRFCMNFLVCLINYRYVLEVFFVFVIVVVGLVSWYIGKDVSVYLGFFVYELLDLFCFGYSCLIFLVMVI